MKTPLLASFLHPLSPHSLITWCYQNQTSRPDVCFGCSKLAVAVLDQLVACSTFVNWHSLEMGWHRSPLPPMWRCLSAKLLTTVPLEIRAPVRRGNTQRIACLSGIMTDKVSEGVCICSCHLASHFWKQPLCNKMHDLHLITMQIICNIG